VSRVLLPLAAGFEEIEAVSIIDVLRRADVEVVVASLQQSDDVKGAHGISIRADACLLELLPQDFDLMVLPGGEPGTTNLAADETLGDWLQQFATDDKPVAAICAAPRILAAMGMLQQIAATSHPSVKEVLIRSGADYQQERVVRTGRIVTSRGPGTAIEFALELLSVLDKGQEAAQLRDAMLVQR